MGQDASANLDPLTENINVKKTGTVSLIQLFTVVRTDTTLDLSQKAEKVSKQTNKRTNERTHKETQRTFEISCTPGEYRNSGRCRPLGSAVAPVERMDSASHTHFHHSLISQNSHLISFVQSNHSVSELTYVEIQSPSSRCGHRRRRRRSCRRRRRRRRLLCLLTSLPLL